MRSLIITVLFLGMSSLYAQEIVGNKEIDREALLIEASKEKMLGRLDKAKELYKQLLTEFPNTEAAAYELARILMVQKQPEEAIIWVSKAVTANPSNVWYSILKADALQAMGQYKDAAAVYEQLTRQHPTQSNYFYKWAFYLVKANELNAALKVYDDLERRDGMDENLIRLKHGLYVAQGDQKKATRELLRLAEAHPKNIDYWHNLAEYYTQNGEKEQARGVYRKILALDANDAKANLAQAGGDVNKQNDAQYLGSLRQTFESRDVSLEVKLGKILPLVEKFKTANDATLGREILQLSEILEQQYPKEAKPFAISATVLSKQGEKAEAVAKMRQALNQDDTDFSYWETFFGDLETMGDMPALLKATENALDVFPNKPEIYVYAASAELALHHLSNVEDLVSQALPMSAKFPVVRQHLMSLLAMAQTQENNIAGADQNFAEALKINANAATVLAWQSLSFAQRTNGATQALQLAQKALQTEPQSRLATFALARAQFRSGNNSEAKSKIESLLPSANPLYLEHYGDVLFKSGDTAAAVQQWGLAVTKGSTSPSLKKNSMKNNCMNKGLTISGWDLLGVNNRIGNPQLFLLLLLAGLNFACGASKKLSTTDLSSTELLVRRIETNQIKAKTFDARAKIDFRSPDMSASATARIKMQKDSSVWVTLSKLGFEIARALITKDSVHVIDRINNEYAVYGLDHLSKEYQLPGNLLLIQQVVLGNPFFLSRKFSSTSEGDSYVLSDSGSGKEVKMSLEKAALRLRNLQYLEPGASRSLNLHLEEYKAANDKQDFSYLRKFVVDSRETGKVEVNIQFTQVELNVPISMPFDVPQRFKRIK